MNWKFNFHYLIDTYEGTWDIIGPEESVIGAFGRDVELWSRHEDLVSLVVI